MYGIIIIGPPCSGKSTIGQNYSQQHKIGYISSGDIARRMAARDPRVDKELSEGKLAPEAAMRHAIGDEILMRTGRDMPFILDGFPRFPEQNEWLLSNFGKKIHFIYVLIDTPIDLCVKRAKLRDRSDDAAISKRITYFQTETLAMVEYIDLTVKVMESSDAVDAIHRHIMRLASTSDL